MARSIEGSMCQALASTVLGYCAAVSITLPITLTPFFSRRRDANCPRTSRRAAVDHREGGFRAGGSYQEPMNDTRNLTSGLTERAPSMKACISRFTSGIG